MNKRDKGFLVRSMIIGLAGAAGLLCSLAAPAQNADHLGGAKASGRVATIYLKGGDKLFLDLKQAPRHVQKSAERWVDIEVTDAHANETGVVRTLANASAAGVQVGDLVEIEFAHRENPRHFPLKEITRVTAVVAAHDATPGRDAERRKLAIAQ